MPIPSDARKKNGLFGPSSKKEWTEMAKRELGAGYFPDQLVHRIENIDVLPYYDQSDLPDHTGFQLPSSQNEFTEPRAWSNVPRIRVTDAASANRQALTWLNAGADGILFELQGAADVAILLKNIQLNYCHTCFLADTGHETFVEAFANYVAEKKMDFSSIEGAIFWKSSSIPHPAMQKLFEGWRKFRALGIIADPTLGISSAISSLLAKAVIQIDSATERGCPLAGSLRAIAFLYPTDKDFFWEIAKLKVLRMLFTQVANAFDVHFNEQAHIHSVTIPDADSVYEPQGDLITGTLEGLSAVFGGCNALTIDTVDPALTRIALNTSSILKEEGHVGKVADPTAGSYFLEKLILQLADESWKKFQIELNEA